MNRAFFIVIPPAVLVAAAYLAVNYGQIVPRWVAYGAAGAAVIALVWGLLRRGTSDSARRR